MPTRNVDIITQCVTFYSVPQRETKYKHLKQNRTRDQDAHRDAASDDIQSISKIDRPAFVGVCKQAAQFGRVRDARAGDDLCVHFGLGD